MTAPTDDTPATEQPSTTPQPQQQPDALDALALQLVGLQQQAYALASTVSAALVTVQYTLAQRGRKGPDTALPPLTRARAGFPGPGALPEQGPPTPPRTFNSKRDAEAPAATDARAGNEARP